MPLPALLSVYSPLIPIVLFLLYFNKSKKTVLWVFFIYSIYAFSNDNLLLYIQNLYSQNRGLKYLIYYNNTILQVFTILEYLFFSLFFYLILNSKSFKKIILYISVIFTLFCFYFIIDKGVKQFDSIQTSVEGILLIVYSILYFYEKISSTLDTFIYQNFKFWIVFGILIYIAGNLFLFTYTSDLPSEVRDQYWIINYVSNISKNLLFALAIYFQAKEFTVKPILEDPFKNLI